MREAEAEVEEERTGHIMECGAMHSMFYVLCVTLHICVDGRSLGAVYRCT